MTEPQKKPEAYVAARRSAPPRFLVSVPFDAGLSWLINESESAMGMRSALPSLVAMIETSGESRGARDELVEFSNGVRDVSLEMSAAERRLTARKHRVDVGRARVLRARFQALTPSHQDTLFEAYGARPFPHEAASVFGGLAGVALLTACAVGGHPLPTGRGEWLLTLCRKPAQHAEPLAKMLVEANALVRVALAAWRGEATT